MKTRPGREVLCFGAMPFLAALVVMVLIALAGCGGSKVPVRDLGTRAVVIGIDGADWAIIDALIADGTMPNLARFKGRAAWGRIETLYDIPLSPVIWTSVATGKTAAKHGIGWFMVDRPDGTRVPIGSHNRQVKALWNVLAAHRRRPVVVGWWATFPAEAVGRGAIISDALGVHGFGASRRGDDDTGKTHPADLFPQAHSLVPAEQQVSFDFVNRFINITPEDYDREMFRPGRFPHPDPANPLHLFQQYAVTAQGYTAIAEELLEERPYDLFMVYYEQVDSLSHLFMKYAPPWLEWIDDDRSVERYRDVVAEWYRYQDELLGRLLAKIDLDATAVFILSDHGFKSGARRIRSEATVDPQRAHLDHETHGIFLAAGPHLRAGVEVTGASVLDLTPTLLHYLGFPVAKDMDGKVVEDVFDPAFMTRNPIRYVETYEDPRGQPKTERVAHGSGDDDPASTERQLAGLEALGYVSRPSPAAGDGDTPGAGDPSSPEVHNNLGRVHLRNGDLVKAQREFERALELDPVNAEALLNIGSIHAAEGRLAAAEHFAKRALQVNPNSTPALAQLAEIELGRGNLAEAIRLFEEALAVDDSLPFLFQGYGDVLQRAGRFADAERAFRSVLELDPDSFQAYYNLGVTYGNQGRVDEAVTMYEQALERSPEHPEAGKVYNNLGAIHLSRGEIDQARMRFEQAVRSSAVNLEARYNLALIYLEEDDADQVANSEQVVKAIELLEAAAALEPNHELVTLRLGFAYLRMGRGEDAHRSFLLVRRLYPENWLAPLGLAVLHARAEQQDEAKRLLGEAIRLGGDEARTQAQLYPVLRELN